MPTKNATWSRRSLEMATFRSAVCIYLESEERIYDSADIVSIHILVVAKRDPRASVVCAVDAADPCNDRHM
jgi:hypothetical protein